MWVRHSSKTRPCLVQSPCNTSLTTKDYRIVKPENWVRKINFCTELGLYVVSSHPKTISRLTKPLCKVGVWKKKKKRTTTKKNRGYIWGRHSSKTRPSLVKPPCNASHETKDCRFVKPENWVNKLNIHTELELCGVFRPKDNVWIDKSSLHKNNRHQNQNRN